MTTGTFTHNRESMPKDKDMVEPLPLSNLRPCVFGENGVPAQQIHEGELLGKHGESDAAVWHSLG